MDHDHSTATHSMTCPVDGCDHVIEVHAHNEDEAVQAVMEAGKDHFVKVQAKENGMSSKEMEKTTREHITAHSHDE